MTKTLPQPALDIINKYKALNINGKIVRTPYYRNVKRVRGELRSLTGKGSPQEIVDETKIYAKLRGFDLDEADAESISKFQEEQGIGIDCSGYVMHILSSLAKAKGRNLSTLMTKKHLKTAWGFITWPFKYIANTAATVITDENNSYPIGLKEIKPGDLIRLRGAKRGDHIAMISEVEYDDNTNLPIHFKYTHSTPHYDELNGIKEADVTITDINRELKDQKWSEIHTDGKNYTHMGLVKEYEDNGLRRLKFADKLGL
jgi:hypothetical protein